MRLVSSFPHIARTAHMPQAGPALDRRAKENWQLAVSWARSTEQVCEAQQLRYRVFALEMGARLTPPPGTEPGLDADHFDSFCDHLLVHARQDGRRARTTLVGTYRVLSPAAARRAGGLYMDTEFDLAPLTALRPDAVELGRSCVDPAWRSGAVIMALWSALGAYMRSHGAQTMIGCASIPLQANPQGVADLWQQLSLTHLVAPRWQVKPLIGMPPDVSSAGNPDTVPMLRLCTAAGARIASGELALPPLIKGYLRCGACLLGPPALDLAFNTADLPMMLQVGDLAPRYRRHFLGH